ncbi:MAG: hypothetical protein AAFY43_09045 [Pseudomonadota bacterium]
MADSQAKLSGSKSARDTLTQVGRAVMPYLSVWVLIAAALFVTVIVPAAYLASDTFSTGDHASNSMLVEKAKSLSLTHGNYSRVGFYHPGPYFFYVMAIGELLFHDLLPISRSAEGAHQIAIGVQNLVLLGIAQHALARFFAMPRLAAIAIFLAAAITMTVTPSLHSLWPPNMYVIPALLFSVGLFLLIAGDNRALWSTALGAGILVHGHASNIGLVPIMVMSAFIAVIARRRLFGEPVTPAAIYDWAKPHLPAAIAVFAVFVFPYLFQTLTEWPGETPKYFAQARSEPNSVGSGIAYSIRYWGLWSILAFFISAAILLNEWMADREGWQPTKAVSLASTLFSVGSMLAIISGAMVFYAVSGIDQLSETYIGLWYLGGVAGGIAILFLILASRSAHLSRMLYGFAAAWIACVALIMFQASHTSMHNSLRADADEVLQAISPTDDEGITALAIKTETPQDWVTIWPIVAGLANLDFRDGQRSICLTEDSWHLLFHAHARCSGEDLEQALSNGQVVFARAEKPGTSAIANLASVDFLDATDGQAFSTVDFGPGDRAFVLPTTLVSGWSAIEAAFVWQVDPVASLRVFAEASEDPILVRISLSAFLPEPNLVQDVTLSSQGRVLTAVTFTTDQLSQTATFSLPPSAQSGFRQIDIQTSALYSPSDYLEGNSDTRTLGLRFEGLVVTDGDTPFRED